MTVYDCFNDPFPVDCGITYLNLPPIPMYDITRPPKIAWYTPDMIPSGISVTFRNSDSNFTAPSESPQVILLTSNDTNTWHIITRDNPGHDRGEEDTTVGSIMEQYDTKMRLCCSAWYFNKKVYYCHGSDRSGSHLGDF